MLLAAAAGAYFFAGRGAPPPDSLSQDAFAAAEGSSSPPVSITSTTPVPEGTKEYKSAAYGFALYYPDGLTVAEHPLAGSSTVVLFQSEAAQQGFEIFVTPYAEPAITQARFLMDEPSGVMNDPQNITIDGAAATEFFSTNPAMGASREIWFLHGGYLFEVTAPASLDAWLLQIMGTWRFM